ncbi:MAG: diphthine synthase [Thaumarchaeota archaeon]|nr:diphthine synthase [Nitrososphaerota archaeon]
MGISGYDSIPSQAVKVLSDADIIYMEQFTSPISDIELAKIKKMSHGEFHIAKRWLVEDGSEILKNAKKNDVVLLSYGDPYVATTHTELRTRATMDNIKTCAIHASSSLTSLIGECGLHFYKIGRIATVMSDAESLTTPYYVIYKNIIEGNHTVLLLEYNQDKDFFLDPKDALNNLLRTEDGQQRHVLSPATFAIVASRVGQIKQGIMCGNISSLLDADFGMPPHTIIIPGRLHFTESDALKATSICLDEPQDNITEKISTQMMKKYVPMIREALEEVKACCKDGEHEMILENAELYIRDAERFLEDGQDEVAVLSIGYADGLVDALRIQKGLGPKM